jgi:5'-nucleotidase
VPYPLNDKLVIGVASSALFDLTESDAIFRKYGLERYRTHQRAKENDTLRQGVAYPLIKRLLALNGPVDTDRAVEVILLSRNDPDTGLRVMKSIEAHNLDMTRAVFGGGRSPLKYLKALNGSLFLSASEADVREAIERGAPAGRVLPTDFIDDESESELRIAFDFDGIIADDSAEVIFKSSGLAAFHDSEAQAASLPMPRGPLAKFFIDVARLQMRERSRAAADPSYDPRLRIAIVTARNAPAHERVVTTLRDWGIEADEVFFLGGIDKGAVLAELKPHIFFDDQMVHLDGTHNIVPSVHVPFGVANVPTAPEPPISDEALPEATRRQSDLHEQD